MKAEWCPGGGKQLPKATFERDPDRRVRCGTCGRLLKVRQIDCHDGQWAACWHSYVPAHKKKVKKARKPSRRQGKCPRNRLTKRGNRI